MAKVQSVDDYIAAQPEAIRPRLEQLRSAIRRALPNAEEVISYQIPAFRVEGGVAIFFAGWKKHLSVHPINSEHLEALGVSSGPWEVNDKGTLRLPLDRPVPATLIARLAKLRARQIADASRAKRTKTATKPRAKTKATTKAKPRTAAPKQRRSAKREKPAGATGRKAARRS